jgi:hypothetical protein
MELELPPMKIEVFADDKPTVKFNTPYKTSLMAHNFGTSNDWINKEIEKEWEKNKKVNLSELRNELNNKVEKYNNGELDGR